MSEVMIPTWIVPEGEEQEMLDEGSSVFRAAFAPGLAQRQSYGGLRLKLSRRHTVRTEERAQLVSVMKATRGSYNTLRSKVHFALRGSFPATELLTNNTFANGVTGWTTSSSELTRTVNDRVMRVMRTGLNANASIYQLVSGLTQYAPYVARAMVSNVLPSYRGAIYLGSGTGSTDYGATGTLTDIGLHTLAAVIPATSAFFILRDFAGTGRGTSPVWTDFSYVSLSRCALVDNGINQLLQSDELDTSWTATRSSVDDQAAGTNAPDGTATADSIIEDSTAGSSHYVSQVVTVAATANLEYSFTVALKAGTRTWARVMMFETTGNTGAAAYFNLSSGAVGTVDVGGNWSDGRAFIASLGNSWYQCTVVARKTNSATSVSARILLATADTTDSYTGDGASNIYAWRATFVQSGVPTRLVQTTTTASTGTSQTGSALYIKGLPASTSGLLLPEDVFEINGELKTCTAPLNSDAAGLGYLQFEPPLFRSPADSDPVIILDPMGKFLVSNIKVGNDFGTQARVSYDLEHIYE